jgi:hypothetical protein
LSIARFSRDADHPIAIPRDLATTRVSRQLEASNHHISRSTGLDNSMDDVEDANDDGVVLIFGASVTLVATWLAGRYYCEWPPLFPNEEKARRP